MSEPLTNYFTCTLGEASLLGCTKPTQRISEFLEEQSQTCPDLPALGFYLPSTNDIWDHRVITFGQLNNGTSGVAQSFKILLSDIELSNTVALLAPSSTEFLFIWLGLIRLGHSVLLIAPQFTPNAIAELCQQCQVGVLIYDKLYDQLAFDARKEAKQLGLHLEPILAPIRNETHVLDLLDEAAEYSIYSSQSSIPNDELDVAYLHHTSGTSTGIPRPIPQTHRGGIGVLPRLDGSAAATFTATPLYHGGVADVFRAWTSNAMIWLFPSKDRPIRATDIVKCLDIAQTQVPPVKYFSSVPYILQMMADDQVGIKLLQSLDVVGVGGAALPSDVGDKLVSQGVNLVSRFGSAECGFLMSSHRNYTNDKEWQYLRPGSHLRFEPADGLSELIVEPGWPHMVKTNRDDGSYATADLFVPHPSLPNAWKYHSRADSQLTLVTGKKFDPAPMEDTLAASSSAIANVLIFGNGRPYPGALIFLSEEGQKDLRERFQPTLEKLNNESQNHAHISPSMVFVMPYDEKGLEKSSKGTILRSRAEARYRDVIEKAYADEGSSDVTDKELTSTILDIVNTVLSSTITPETDLFAAGVDSVRSVRIRQALSKLLPEGSSPLPLSIVQDAGTVDNLSQHLLKLRQGQSMSVIDPQTLMLELVEKYGDFHASSAEASSAEASSKTAETEAIETTSPQAPSETILLTGSTGSLGSHVLSSLLSTGTSHIYILVRDAAQANKRVRNSLSSRQLPIPPDFDQRVTIIPCQLQEPRCGLDSTTWSILSSVTCIIHLAWAVNFLLPLQKFSSHFIGLHNLISLALSSTKPPRIIFCSSTASVALHPVPIPEVVITDPSICTNTGYARSKWVAENILRRAASHQRLHITIIRVGQLSANAQTGVWNASEAYPLMLSTAKKSTLGCLPDLDKARRAQGGRGEELDWLPVDTAAKAFVEVVREHIDQLEVLHILPPPRDQVKTWSSLLVAMKMAEGVNIVSIDDWLGRLERLREDKGIEFHPAFKLIDFWRTAYTVPLEDGESAWSSGASLANTTTHLSAIDMMGKDFDISAGFDMGHSLMRMPSLKEARQVDMAYVMKFWGWIKKNV